MWGTANPICVVASVDFFSQNCLHVGRVSTQYFLNPYNVPHNSWGMISLGQYA